MTIAKLPVLVSAGFFVLFSPVADAAETGTDNAIAGHGSTGPGGYDLAVSARNVNGNLGHVKLLGGITGPVV
jgi:hypothetical protein